MVLREIKYFVIVEYNLGGLYNVIQKLIDMLSTIQNSFLDNILFYQKVRIKRKFSNEELLLFHFFHKITEIYPRNVIIIKNFVFFFINNENYFEAKSKLPYMRKRFVQKKVVIIREEDTLIKLLFAFFPDPYIHDLRIEINVETGKREIIIGFLSFIERGIAIGCKGNYIKAVNRIFENHMKCEENNGFPIIIKCEVFNL
ncbi:MAG: hypothetical protein EAX89_07260 [Candidatus Lokiarchaeota archaeon]|nr:hypothetical protein [Candidatus Lokiarchaeota archaeon]